MNWIKRISQVVIIVVFGTMLLIPQGMITSVVAENSVHSSHKNPPMVSRGDTLGDLQVRAVFYFAQGKSVVDSFHIFEQSPGGYDFSGANAFTLIGGISPDKMMLYNVIDNSHHKRHHDIAADQYRDFNVDIELMIEDVTYRLFTYSGCDITDYTITTLYDKEETFSKSELKFVIADIVNFTCEDYHPHCPYCEETMGVSERASLPKSSMDYQAEQRSTWPDYWE